VSKKSKFYTRKNLSIDNSGFQIMGITKLRRMADE
jgi:hypothetical protein